MHARIFRPAKTAMQSGRAKTARWCLEFAPESRRFLDPLMGWTGSADTNQQVVMRFDTQEAAVAFCKKHGIAYDVLPPAERRVRPRAYADNFRYRRAG